MSSNQQVLDKLPPDVQQYFKTKKIPDHIPAELRELWEMGAHGKLWTLEVVYTVDSEQKILRWRNMTDDQLMARRSKMFMVGFSIPVADGEPGHWRIICPMDILRVDLYRQSGYFSG